MCVFCHFDFANFGCVDQHSRLASPIIVSVNSEHPADLILLYAAAPFVQAARLALPPLHLGVSGWHAAALALQTEGWAVDPFWIHLFQMWVVWEVKVVVTNGSLMSVAESSNGPTGTTHPPGTNALVVWKSSSSPHNHILALFLHQSQPYFYSGHCSFTLLLVF